MYLIDTDILIYSLKGDARVMAHLERTAAAPKAISVISYGELLYGAHKSARPDENLARVRRVGEVLPVIEVSPAIMETFGTLKARLEQDGRRLDDFDVVIAATAMTIGYRLVTNNERHFARIDGLYLEKWAKSTG
jgi:tRNA(fMet)-specific endonuclease VapC